MTYRQQIERIAAALGVHCVYDSQGRLSQVVMQDGTVYGSGLLTLLDFVEKYRGKV